MCDHWTHARKGQRSFFQFQCPPPSLPALTPHFSPLLALPFPFTKSISQPTPNNINHTQPQRRTPHQPSGPKLLRYPVFPPSREHEISSRPGRRDARGVLFVALEVHPGTEEEDGWEEHGEGLEGAEVLGGY